jgi:hypothetical protein
MMKKTISILTLVILSFAIAYSANDIIRSFTAVSVGNTILLEWETINESNVKSFTAERSRNGSNFTRVEEFNAEGKPSKYNYNDQSAFMKDNGDGEIQNQIYQYRIKVNYNDGSFSYSSTETVSNHSPSSYRRTWGMIKEMFR